MIPASAVVALGSGLILKLFGGSYAAEAKPLLIAFAAGGLAVALTTWANFALKLTGQMRQLVVNNVVYVTVSVSLTLLWASRGLVWVGVAWGAGNLASGVVALVAVLGHRRRSLAAVRAQKHQLELDPPRTVEAQA